MKIVISILIALVTAGLVLFAVNKKIGPLSREYALRDLITTTNTVKKNIDDLSQRLVSQLSGFCLTVADDRDFTMKLIVEKDYSAPEVADIAPRHMKAMGFSFLEITDADYRILSSGHFPASAGNSAKGKKELPEGSASFILDNIKGREVLTYQVKIPFSCTGAALYAVGGISADSGFVARLRPHVGVVVLLEHGGGILGMDEIETMSEIKDYNILINDKPWIASSLTLPLVGEENYLEMIILMEKPDDFSLLDLL